MEVEFRPLTPDTWNDFEVLFGAGGACGGCWCQWWKVKRSRWEEMKGNPNREAIKTYVFSGNKPGIIAYIDGQAVGWCAVEPRERYPVLQRSRSLKPIDEMPVWSITCLFIARDFRNKGLSVKLIREAIEWVKESGGEVIEGYPVIPKKDKMPATFAWTGIVTAFEKAGFSVVQRPSASKAIMRYYINAN
jgi:GNAT superfamily N-acetyltransferase